VSEEQTAQVVAYSQDFTAGGEVATLRTFAIRAPDVRGYMTDKPVRIRIPDDDVVIEAMVVKVTFDETGRLDLTKECAGEVAFTVVPSSMMKSIGAHFDALNKASFFNGFSVAREIVEPHVVDHSKDY
jgi:hypothetical protein